MGKRHREGEAERQAMQVMLRACAEKLVEFDRSMTALDQLGNAMAEACQGLMTIGERVAALEERVLRLEVGPAHYLGRDGPGEATLDS